jgi:hypothetical protein
MTSEQKKLFVEQLKARAAAMCQPATASRVVANLDEMLKNIGPEGDAKYANMLNAARAGDKAMQSALAELRVFTTDNFLLASSNPLSFFETVALGDSDEPFIENTSRQEVTVAYIGSDGRAKKSSPIRFQEQRRIELYNLSTEEYEYFIRDLYKGNVKSPAMANVDLARDLTYKINKLLWPFIAASIFQNFNLAGKRSGRVYVPHSTVDVANLPTGNLLTPAGNTAASLWRKECMDAVIQYIASWGSGAFPDGEFSKNIRVVMPSSHMTGFLQQIQFTSFPNSKVEAVFDNAGLQMSYGGYNWTLIGDNTLSPSGRMAYVNLGKPIGFFFTKTSMDEVFVDDSVLLRKQNKEAISQSKVIGFGLPVNKAVNIVGVNYQAKAA